MHNKKEFPIETAYS